MCRQLRTSANINERIARIYQDLRTSTNICESLRTAARMRRCGSKEACKYRHGDMQQHGKTEIRKCRNANLRKSTNIREHQKQNIEHFIKEHAERQKCPSLPPPSATAPITHPIFPFLPAGLYIVSAIESLADFGR